MTLIIAGMTVPQARQIHQERKALELCDMANNSINPKPRVVSYLREVWLADNHGSLRETDMFSAIKRYAENHPTSKIAWDEVDNKFVVVLATEFMLRVHKEFKEAGEVVFVETTHHVNQINTAVISLLCASPAGAMPLGVILSSQDEMSYTKGMLVKMLIILLVYQMHFSATTTKCMFGYAHIFFSIGFCLLKDVLGEAAFFGKNHPDYFITDNYEAAKKALGNVWPHAKQYMCIFHLLQQVWRWLCMSSPIRKEDRSNMMSVAQRLVYAKTDSEFTQVWKEYLSTEHSLGHQSYTK